jgi:Xaa-Pro aminopeptidase
MELTPHDELMRRITRFQEALQANGLDGALIVQSTDLYYFSGTSQQSHLYVPTFGEPLLMARKSLTRARHESRLASDRIIALRSVRQLVDLIADHRLPRPGRLGMELDVMPVNLFRDYEQVLAGIELVDCSPAIRRQRAIKSDYELHLMRRAARQSEAVYRAIPGLLRTGISEVALASEVEAIARREGHQGIIRMRTWNNEIFYGHLMAGESAAVPSYMASPTGGPGMNPAIAQGPGTRPIGAGEPILVDYLFAPDGYIVDQTRIFAIGGLADELMDAQRAMLAVQAAVMAAGRPGVAAGDLWEVASATAAKHGLEEHFMGHGTDRVRFVGHGVGLELDELPVLAAGQDLRLEAGMVIALEPKAIFPGRGVLGIENTHVVTEDGLERLTMLSDELVIV